MSERERKEAILRMFQSKKGGYTRESLAALGVPWPPPKGWKKRLLGEIPKHERPKKTKKVKQKSSHRKSGPKPFHRTREWAAIRYDALKASNGCCELCGRSSKDGAVLQVDHIKPVSTHWHLRAEPSNLQVLCSSCNWGKGARDDTDWREPDVRTLMGERLN